MLENLSENEFNELVKKVSEANAFEYNPAAWANVERRLRKRRRRKFFVIWFSGTGIFLLILLSLWYSTGFNIKNTQNVRPDINDQISNNINAPSSSKLSIEEFSDLASTDTLVHFKKNQINIREEKSSRSNHSVNHLEETEFFNQSSASTRVDSESLTAEKEKQNIEVNRTSKPIQDFELKQQSAKIYNPIEEETKLAPEGSIKNKGITEYSTNTTDNKQKTLEADIYVLHINSLSLLPVQHNIDTLEISSDRIIIIEDSLSRRPLLSFELFIGKEWSTSNISYFRSSDQKFGFNVNYAVTNKLSTTLGLGYKEDHYGAGAGAYKPLKGFWTDGIAPVYTRANCHILEIPIGLNYHFSGIAENSLFASAGLTSIFMLREDYYFNYPEDNKEHIDSWSGQNESKHLFNDIYISAGYQRRISNNLSLKLSPYFQIPLKGIGHGNLKLYTLGTKFSVQFLTYKPK